MITTIKNNETKYLNDIEDWICLSCDHFTTINQDYCANCGKIKGDLIN